MSKKEWTVSVGKPAGDRWTLERLQEHVDGVNDGTVDRNSADAARGVKGEVLWCIHPWNVLCPPLHSNELFVNAPIKELLRWINIRCELLPPELLESRLAQLDVLIELESVAEELKGVNQQIDFLKAEAAALKPDTRTVDRVRQFDFRDDAHRKDCFDNLALLEEAKDEALTLGELHRDYVKDKKKIDIDVSTYEKKCFGALEQDVRQRIEHMLEQVYKTVRSACHGGDYEGNHCRKFMRKAEPAMNDVQTLLLDIPESDRAADDDEIRKCCGAFKRLFQCFDGLIHHCQQPFGTLTDNNMKDVTKLVGMLDRLWRQMFQTVPPKAHAMWHLLEDLERFRGLKCHQESKIERAHQIGKRIDLLFRVVNDIDKKIDCTMRHQHTADKASMKVIQETVKENRSRGKRTAAVVEDEDNDRHAQLMLLLSTEEIDGEFPPLMDVAIASRKLELQQQQELETDVNVNINVDAVTNNNPNE